MSNMLTGQELYCFLQGYYLKRPTVDNWESIKNTVEIFLDCWHAGRKVHFTHSELSGLLVCVSDPVAQTSETVFELDYDTTEDPTKDMLEIRWTEDGVFHAEYYPIDWTK